jgi:hypothetical protein
MSSNHDWRTVSAAASATSEQPPSIHAAELIVGDKSQQGQVQPHQQVQQQQPPSSLEYRIDGEVLQLTRVPQAEAMRLVMSGETVIHVADPQQDSNLHGKLFLELFLKPL